MTNDTFETIDFSQLHCITGGLDANVNANVNATVTGHNVLTLLQNFGTGVTDVGQAVLKGVGWNSAYEGLRDARADSRAHELDMMKASGVWAQRQGNFPNQ